MEANNVIAMAPAVIEPQRSCIPSSLQELTVCNRIGPPWSYR